MTDAVYSSETGADGKARRDGSVIFDGDNRIQYDPAAGSYTLTHDWERDVSLSTTLVLATEALGEGDGLGPRLADSIDPDALDALFEPDGSTSAASVSFSFDGYAVTITSDGVIELDPS
jgi:hypothetical protein